MKRYIVIDGSETAHCCFVATVKDSKEDNILCECFEKEAAEQIANALNTLEECEQVV